MERKIVDLGIGRGGEYIRRDTCNRIGLDLRHINLQLCQRHYGILPLRADANTAFPFSASSIDGVDCFFPHHSLVFGLTQPYIWHEIKRIMKPEGNVRLIFDSCKEGRVILDDRRQHVLTISDLEYDIEEAAHTAGFLTQSFLLSSPEVSQLGTIFSKKITQRMDKCCGDFHMLHQITAVM